MHDTLLKFLKVPFHQFLWKKGYRNGLEHLRWTMAVLCSRFLRNTGALKISGENNKNLQTQQHTAIASQGWEYYTCIR